MNILIIHQYFLEKEGVGGSRFNQFAKYWSSYGHKITVLAGTVDYASGKKDGKYKGRWVTKEMIDKDITVLKCYVSEFYNKNFLGRFWGYFSFAVSATWATIFYSGKQDIVIATSPPLFVAFPGYIVSRLKRIPLIFELRDLWPKFAIDLGILKNKTLITFALWLERFIYHKADIINVLTPAFEKYLIEEKNVPKEKIIYIPNAADLDIFQPNEKNNWVRQEYGWKDKFVVLYIGAHGVANDLWQVVRVAEKLKEKENILFVLMGSGMEKDKLRTYVVEHQMTNIQFLDPVAKSKVVDFVNAADICTATLDPVFTTTYPNKVFDYMSCAKPIVLPIDGAIKEVVVDKAKAGIFVEPRNAEGFKCAILELYGDSEKVMKLGSNGYDFVKNNFDRKKLARDYEKQIRELVLKKNNKK